MNLIINTMQREKQRIDYMLEKYRTMLSMLPKGIVSQRNIGDKTYYYLKYRDGESIVSKYIGKQKIKRLYNQLVLTSEKALRYLKFIGKLTGEDS